MLRLNSAHYYKLTEKKQRHVQYKHIPMLLSVSWLQVLSLISHVVLSQESQVSAKFQKNRHLKVWNKQYRFIKLAFDDFYRFMKLKNC